MHSLFLTNWPQGDPDVYGWPTLLKITRKEKKKSHKKENNFYKTGLIRSNCEHAKQFTK